MLLIVQEGRDGCLGDDGKVRFYMVCTTGTSLYILSLPALEVVFVYSPSSQHHQYYAHSSNNMAIPITAGPALLYSSLPPPPDSSGSTAASAPSAPSAPSASSAASELFESVNDVALHFVGPLNGSSPCLVLCLETKENDVYVYVKLVFVIHVGGTRSVTSSTDNIMKIHARITLTVEFIRTCIFLCLFDVYIQ